MISANDVLQVISEIHQYSLLLLELKESGTFGILHSPKDKVNYFKLKGRLGRWERVDLVQEIYGGKVPESLLSLPVEEFLREIEGKKTRHIWLETVEPERRELAFLSISELKAFLRSRKNH
jgi:hypothetical protein